MKKLMLFVVILSLVFVATSVFAKDEDKPKERKGASERAYEHASEQAIFHRVSDWFATIGKSSEEKAKILEERKAERAAKRVEKEAKKAQKETEKAQRKTEKKTEKAKRRKGKGKE